jgi:hypothetical protein
MFFLATSYLLKIKKNQFPEEFKHELKIKSMLRGQKAFRGKHFLIERYINNG